MVAFMNAGNFGLTICSALFKIEGLAWATVYFVTNLVLLTSLGILIAEIGREPDMGIIKDVLRVPAVYAIILAFISTALNIHIPAPISKTIDMFAASAIPLMLIVLGLQVANLGMPKQWKLSISTSGLRLLISPAIALLISSLFTIDGLAKDVAVIQSGMPVAVLIGVLSVEYKLEEELVASSILLSTIISPVTITMLNILLPKI
jgi:predicted permease